jgi:hypothetical protein
MPKLLVIDIGRGEGYGEGMVAVLEAGVKGG